LGIRLSIQGAFKVQSGAKTTAMGIFTGLHKITSGVLGLTQPENCLAILVISLQTGNSDYASNRN
jgi:hypothetical protein